MFKLRISTLMWRFYLMMAVGIIAVYTHQAWMIALTFLIAVSAILGYRIDWPTRKTDRETISLPTRSRQLLGKVG